MRTVTISGPVKGHEPQSGGPINRITVSGTATTDCSAVSVTVHQTQPVDVVLPTGQAQVGASGDWSVNFSVANGDFQPGATVGLLTKIKLSSVLDFNFNPVVVFQKGEAENLSAVQIPLDLVVKAGSVLKLGTGLAVNTGDDYSFSGDNGGRISVGAMIELKIGKIMIHTGAGLASLLTGGLYPSISDSVYIDVNAKYVK
jgi:hypothetical protein